MTLELNEIIQRLERLLVNDLSNTFEELRKFLIPQDDAWDSMVLMEGRYNAIKIKILRGTLSDEQSSQGINQVREDLLHFIQDLKEKDLVGYEPTEEATAYEGHLLYKIPLTMKENKSSSCLVRIAIEKKALLKYIEVTDEVRQKGLEKVSDVMQVELMDPSMNGAFKINAINEPEQLVLKKGYTEWRFEVTPLNSGVFPLLLKVAVLIMVNGKERKREITLEKEIQVTTINEPAQEEIAFVESDVVLNMGASATLIDQPTVKKTKGDNPKSAGKKRDVKSTISRPPSASIPSPSPPSSSPSKSNKGTLRKVATAMSVMLLLLVGVGQFMGGDKDSSGDGSTNPTAANDKLATPEIDFDTKSDGNGHFAEIREDAVFEERTKPNPRVSIPTTAKVETRQVPIPGTDPIEYRLETIVIENKPKDTAKVITELVEVKPARIVKIRVLGGDQVTPELLKSIQTKLEERGYDIGKKEDAQEVINQKFKTALLEYQKNNALPIGNLDFETLEDLGVEFNRN